jgi:hypothetical protein
MCMSYSIGCSELNKIGWGDRDDIERIAFSFNALAELEGQAVEPVNVYSS